MNFNYSSLLFIYVVFRYGCCERLHKQIYSSIEGGAACFRRLNGTHQVGCSSSDKGAVGVVALIRDLSDAQWLALNATAGPYIAVVGTSLFHGVMDVLLDYPQNVAGVLVFDNATLGTSAFTQDSKCPNEYTSGPGSQCSSDLQDNKVWNENGSDLLRTDIPFPIFFLPESRFEEITKIETCFERYNLDRNNHKNVPLCSIQLHSFMFAAVNSAVCLRRSAATALLTPTKVCDPLGDSNVYYSLFPRGTQTESTTKPVILVTARIDSASLFDGVSPGAASSVIGMVTLITAATSLAHMIPEEDANLYDRNVLWTLFNGEAFDYIGSQRVAYDISRNAWPPSAPLSPSDIPLHIELGQIGGSLILNKDNESWPLYGFTPNSLDKVSQILEELNMNLNVSNITLSPVFTENLPPSSLHSFRRILKNVTESGALTEVLLTDFNEKFTNMFYNSALDDYVKIGFLYHNITVDSNGTFIPTDELISNGTMKKTEIQVKIANLASAVARTLYKEVVGNDYAGNVTASAHLVDEMLYCLVRSQACRLLVAADYAWSGSRGERPPEPPPALYVGVAAWAGAAPVLAGHLLALLAGRPRAARDRAHCDALAHPNYSFYWLNGWNHTGVCIQTTMNFSQAVSPAFITPGYDFASGAYSTWTESVWQTMWARVFVAAGGGGARAAAVGGAGATLLAAALTAWLRRHAAAVFTAPPARADAAPSVHSAAGILRTVNC
ncbi:nicastrin [Achroia grisella]|uniref:nicastrin n=1 Tax=Achroia grisella TaxID=688607 RepID=UPI0027D22200|nr:nicastrin [Achroia grisella]